MNYRTHKPTSLKSLAMLTLATVLSAGPARAYQVFVAVDGIPGGSTTAGRSGQIDALAFAWNVHQEDILTSRGAVGGTRPKVNPFTITKSIDQSSFPLAIAAASGQVIRSVTVTVVNPKGSPVAVFAMSNVTVNAVSQAAAASADTSGSGEEVAFAFGKMDMTYYAYDATGRPTGMRSHTLDLAGAKPR